MNTFRKKVLPFDPTPVVEGACNDRICACMVFNALYASDLKCNKTTFRKKKHVLTSKPHLRAGGACKDRMSACMVPYVPFSLI